MDVKENKKIGILFNCYLVFLLLQPVFDILSNLANNGLIGVNFVTYIKPLFVFAILGFLILFVKYKGKAKHVVFYFFLAGFMLGHSYLLHYIYVDTRTILHELRFLSNLVYFISIFISLKILLQMFNDKDEYYRKLKGTLVIMIITYLIFYLLAVVTNTSWLTYEFSDASKLGYRGWYYSGQIFGHMMSIVSPIFIFLILNSKKNIFIKFGLIALLAVPMLLIGTKVPYYIFLVVLVIYVLGVLFYKVIHRDYKIKISNILICLAFLGASLLIYKKIPLYNNTMINKSVEGAVSQEENIEEYIHSMEKIANQNKDNISANENGAPRKNELALKYEDWTLKSLQKLNSLYASGKLHSSDNRNRQLYFMDIKFGYASPLFKFMGLGYLNQPNYLAMERDIVMPFYSFGIVGFILLTGILWIALIKYVVVAFKHLKKIDLEFIFLMEGYCMFFCISFFAGYTYIYTQFGIILAVLMAMLEKKAIEYREVQNSFDKGKGKEKGKKKK